MFNKWVDDWFGKAYSKGGKRLNGIARLTYDWFWTDDPQFGRIDQELKMLKRQNRSEAEKDIKI